LSINVKSRPVEMGYELRCLVPSAYDLQYCSYLGIGVKKLFDQGMTGCVVTADTTGDVHPLYLKDVEDKNGKVRTRLVNMEAHDAKMVFNDSIQYLTDEDVKAAGKYLKDPEEYVFRNILEWD